MLICKGGTHMAGKPGWKHTEATKEKLRGPRSAAVKAKISAGQKRFWKEIRKLQERAERAA
jgi:hypothetical protein